MDPLRRLAHRVVYGNRLSAIPPTQRPYVAAGVRRFHELRHHRLLRTAPVLPAAEYRAGVPVSEIEEFIGCPLCTDDAVQPLFRPSGGKGPARWSYHVVRCPSCGFLYRNPNIKPECLGELYSGNYGSFLSGDYASKRRRRYELTMRMFAPVFDEGDGRRLLDFGCGNGLFLREAEQRGFKAFGVDLSPDSVGQASSRLGAAKVFTGAPMDVPEIAAGEFSVITMWSVLAHLPRPVDELTTLCSLLEPGGVLLILTVNANSLLLKAHRSRWNGFTKNHLMFYSPDTLPRLLALAGFAAVAVAPFYGDTVEAGTTALSADRVAKLRRTVERTRGGNMMRALAFADDAAVERWGGGRDVQRLGKAA